MTLYSETSLNYYLASINKNEINVITVNSRKNVLNSGDSKPVQWLKPTNIPTT